ncbi:MAG: DUF5906 domain-containing protein [Sulfuricaulis sp.]|nr:DUF5906 domain-containing protein [Sulfuricaulis sp.]
MSVERYLAEGWAVVPIPKGEKGPRVENWQHTTFTAADFKPGDNIGIRLGLPSGGLVDIDLDAIEAIATARKFLPLTERIHGRPSKPQSHYWYIAALKSEQFKDVDGSMLVEIRSTGGQTVVPPSLHPKGETLAWEIDRTPASPEAAFLRRMVVLTAISALLARHWPKNGPLTNQHESAGLVAGLLCTLKVQPLEIEYVVEEAARISRDDNVKDRVIFAKATVEKFLAGEKVRGGPELAKEFGDDVVRRIRSWFGDTHSSIIEQLNQKHAVLFGQHGRIVVLTEAMEDGLPQLRFSDPRQMPLLYPQPIQIGENTKGKPLTKALGSVWVTHPRRRFYEGIELAPNGHGNPNYYNLWRGFTVEPKKGSWARYHEHLMLMARGNVECARYIKAWIAETVQRPSRPVGTALSFKGDQGTGKSTFSKWFGALFGAHFLHLDSEQRLLGHFNAHLHHAIVVLADEAVWAGGKAGLGSLKRLITEETLAIERKGVDTMIVRNMVHMMVASNEDWFVPVGFDNRRFAVFNVGKEHQNDRAFFGAVHDELFKHGGLAALLYDLLEYKIDIDLGEIPNTGELEQQKWQSMPDKYAWWLEQLQEGDLWRRAKVRKGNEYEVDPDEVYEGYVQALGKAHRHANLGLKGALGRFLRTLLPEPYPRVIQTAGGKRFWTFPSLSVSRRYYDENFTKMPWLEEGETGTLLEDS